VRWSLRLEHRLLLLRQRWGRHNNKARDAGHDCYYFCHDWYDAWWRFNNTSAVLGHHGLCPVRWSLRLEHRLLLLRQRWGRHNNKARDASHDCYYFCHDWYDAWWRFNNTSAVLGHHGLCPVRWSLRVEH
jgi:hypothetical protein